MEKTLDDIGIYTNIHESGNTVADGHKLYYATCKVCGVVVEKRLADIKASNKVCRHKALEKDTDDGAVVYNTPFNMRHYPNRQRKCTQNASSLSSNLRWRTK